MCADNHHFGEGDYEGSERAIQQLLGEAGKTNLSADVVAVNASGPEDAADMKDVQSPETYIGYDRAENFVSPGGSIHDFSHVYVAGMPRLNEWGLVGKWTIGGEHAVLDKKDGSIVYRFHARDLHLVLGPGPDGKPVRFCVAVDDTNARLVHRYVKTGIELHGNLLRCASDRFSASDCRILQARL